MPTDAITFWTALSSIGSLLAVVVALSLAVVPAIWRKVRIRADAKRQVKRIFSHINKYLENYRFHCVSFININGELYREFKPTELELELQVNPARLLETITDDVRLVRNKELSGIYSASTDVFSGWPEKLSLWYEIEARICLHFGFDHSLKQFAPHEVDTLDPDNPPSTAIKVYSCIACTDDYSCDMEFSAEKDDLVAKVFRTPRCPKHHIPMQVVFRR